jgi:hypothetical protein
VEDVLRLWFDGKLVYDKRSPANPGVTGTIGSLVTKAAGLSFTIYKGTETQLPDPTIEAEEGMGNVPAHRGLCYIIFNDLNLTNYGNRVPVIEAELAYSADEINDDRFSNDLTSGEGGIFSTYNTANMGVDLKRRRIYLIGSGGSAGNGIRVYSLDTLVEVRQADSDDIFSSSETMSSAGDFTVGPDSGFLYTNVGSANTRPIVKINPVSLIEVARFGFESTLGTPPDTFPAIDMACEITGIVPATSTSGLPRRHFLLARTIISDDLCVLDTDDMSFAFYDASFPTNIRGIAPAKPALGVATGWIMVQPSTGNSALSIYKIEIDMNFVVLSDGTAFGLTSTLIDTIPTSTWDDNASNTAAVGPIFDTIDGGLIFLVRRSSPTGTYVIKWREDDGVVWVSQVNAIGVNRGETITQASNLVEGVFGFADSNGNSALIDTTTGEVLLSSFSWDSLTGSANPVGQQFFDGQTQSIVAGHSAAPSNIGQLFLGRSSGNGVPLSSIISDISSRVGLDVASDIDITELTDTVLGYAVTRQMPGRNAVEPLQQAFLFDGVESDGKIFFKVRGRDPTRTLEDDDMIPLNEMNDVVQEVRKQEVELPSRLSVSYMDPSMDYAVGTQAAKRVQQPIPIIKSFNELSLEIPIVMSSDLAAQIAEKLLFTTWNERIGYSWRSPQEQLDLDPADVVNLHINNQIADVTIRTRITKAAVNADLSVSFEGLSEDKVSVVSDSTGDIGSGFVEQTVPGPPLTQLFLLDIPLLRDIDDTGRSSSRLYLAMNGFQPADWPGGTLFTSSDAVSYTNTGVRNPDGVAFGTVVNALPDTSTPFLIDEFTQLRVIMESGALSSVTESEFLNNANVAIIGNPASKNWEIILFQNATVQSDGSYILDTIARGMRGTDDKVATHLDSETFILAESVTISSYLLDLGLLNVTQFYRGVGTGSNVIDADTEPLASSMADLKPYAPVHLDASVDGGDNIDLVWVRRSRIGGELRDGTGEIPLAEDSESYEIDILDQPNPGATVLRTLTSSTPSKQYDNADIITDFGFVPATLSFVVYQISGEVGRGYGREKTVTF